MPAPMSIFVVLCKDGNPCRHPLDQGTWPNFSWEAETAANDMKRLDDPTQSEGARFLRRNDPHAFARWSESIRPSKCGPHRVVEYRRAQ